MTVDSKDDQIRDVKLEGPLAWGARHLLRWYGQYLKNNLALNECAPGTARLRLHAAAEWTMQTQMQQLSCVLKLVETMQQCKAWKGICFLEHTLYDETPLELVVKYTQEESAQKEISKTWVIESQWSMLIEILDDKGPNRSREYVQLQGRFSPSLRASSSGDGESIAQVLRTVPRPDPDLICKLFRHRIRHSECDEHPANPRGETLLAKDHPAAAYTPLHCPCYAHKIHSAATRCWSLPVLAPTVQGVVHTGKFLSTAGSMKRLKDAVGELVKQRLQILVLPVDDAVRSQIVRHCLPPLSHPRRRAVALACSAFFNGHWWKTGVLQHVCTGQNCCESRDASVATGTRLLKKMLSSLFRSVLSKANWAEWSSTLLWYVWGDALNHIAVDAFHLAFARSATESADLEVLMGDSGSFENLGLFEEERAQEHPSEDQSLRQRVENAKSLRIALAFMVRGVWKSVFFLRMSLQPECHLMGYVLQSVSAEWEESQQYQLLETGERQYRVLSLHNGEALHPFFREVVEVYQSISIWNQLAETEQFRTSLLQAMMRCAAVIYQLIECRVAQFPYRMFSLLSAHDNLARVAQGILNTPTCLLDRWSRAFVAAYPRAEELSGSEALQTLHMLAEVSLGTTFSTGRLHSRNLQRARLRRTNKADLQYLSLSHMGWAAPTASLALPQVVLDGPRQRGRPRKVSSDGAELPPHKKRRRRSMASICLEQYTWQQAE